MFKMQTNLILEIRI